MHASSTHGSPTPTRIGRRNVASIVRATLASALATVALGALLPVGLVRDSPTVSQPGPAVPAGHASDAGRSTGSSPAGEPNAGHGSGFGAGSVSAGSNPTGSSPGSSPKPPLGGTELYGYLPYWLMTASMVEYLPSVPLSSVALFSVEARADGSIDTAELGYRRITGDIGRRLIETAHRARIRVDLTFTSFGLARNAAFFGPMPSPTAGAAGGNGGRVGTLNEGGGANPNQTVDQPSGSLVPAWTRTIPALVGLMRRLGLDGINVDVEQLAPENLDGFGAFIGALRTALDAETGGGPGTVAGGLSAHAHLIVATSSDLEGASMAAVAVRAGADRVFLMAYDMRTWASLPGGVDPLARRDDVPTIPVSIAQYAVAGVPADRILLGLPLYGMTWPVDGPTREALPVGPGRAWIPANHRDVLLAPDFRPNLDRLELQEWFTLLSPGAASASATNEGTSNDGATQSPSGAPGADETTWLATYYDSPATLRPKLALARDSGFAGAGFWAVGDERGLPGYLELMGDFRAGSIGRAHLYVPVGP
jgi:Glycosyl hydrolases family 18